MLSANDCQGFGGTIHWTISSNLYVSLLSMDILLMLEWISPSHTIIPTTELIEDFIFERGV